MFAKFEMSTDEPYPVYANLEVRGTRARLEMGRSFTAFIDADEVERFAALLQSAAMQMRNNGSCSACGGKGYSGSRMERIACIPCVGQGVTFQTNGAQTT